MSRTRERPISAWVLHAGSPSRNFRSVALITLACCACRGSMHAPGAQASAVASVNAGVSAARPVGGGSDSAGSDAGRVAPRAGNAAAAGAASMDARDGGVAPGGGQGGDGGVQVAGSGAGNDPPLERFSFFMTSLVAMRELSGSQQGFGGDLRFGEKGENAGLKGADKICTTIANKSMPGAGKKHWRAFLSATKGGADGGPVHAIDRVGEGPWYDRLGRIVARNRSDLLQVRPAGADPIIKNDLPNEHGVPNHNPDGTGEVDNHDVLTGTNSKGQLYDDDPHVTCNDWTNAVPDRADAPRVGHSWPRPLDDWTRGPDGGKWRDDDGPGGEPLFDAENWMSSLNEAGCGAGVSIVEMGGPMEANPTVGSGGGYGAIYCFALMP